MIKNYFKTAWRNLKASKFYSLINISGLAIGLAAGIMLLLWVQNQLSFDKFNKDYQNIYQLSAHFKSNGKDITWTGVPGPLAVFAKSIPQVKSLVRMAGESDQVLATDKRDKVIDGFHIAYVDSSFFNIFDYPLVKGNSSDLFPNINSIIITQSTAAKLFGKEKAIGKTILRGKFNFTVTGVLKDFPQNSSLQYDAIIPMGFYGRQFTTNGGNSGWKTIDADLGNYSFDIYVKLQDGASPAKVGRAFSAAYKKARNGDSNTIFGLENLADKHLVDADGNNAALQMVRIFILVAILLLVIAGINYVNLSTARALTRSKEVGVRKIIGANKKQLFFQFIIETFLLFCVATIIAFLLIILLMPLYNQLSGENLVFSLTNPQVWEITGSAVLGTLLAASIYPALVLSAFHPIQSLKGKVSSGIGAALFRKILVVFQFAISVILIISTFVIGSQLSYVRHKNLGYDKSYVFTVGLPDEVVNHLDAVKNTLKNDSHIEDVSTSDISDFTSLSSSTSDLDWPGKPASSTIYINQSSVDKDFIPMMKIQLIAGQNFSGNPSDSSHYILNEAAVKEMGLKKPYIGQQISFHDRKGAIIGVMKDFNFQSLKNKISPLIFFKWWQGSMLYVRTTAEDAQQAIAAVQKQYKEYAGDIPFSYNFLDKQFETKYKDDQRAGMLFNLFACIAIIISCLGLLGLATYTAQVRTKEIGVRKVLGASVGSVVSLLAKDFIALVLIAFIIASPVAWWAMHKWLQDFAYRINIAWWIFLLAGFMAMIIALATVSFQAIKAAIANPVRSLRTE